MPIVTFMDEQYECSRAIKCINKSYIHLYDENNLCIASFGGISNFNLFSITDGTFEEPCAIDDCYVSVINDEGIPERTELTWAQLKVAGNHSSGSDYGVCAYWSDKNPDEEDRLYRFVTIVPGGTTVQVATSTAVICGVTTDTAAFIENYHEGYEEDSTNCIVGILGIVKVLDNGTLTVGDRCVSDDEGKAVKSTNQYGYPVLERVDGTHVRIAMAPNIDQIQRLQTSIKAVEKDVSDLDMVTGTLGTVINAKPNIYKGTAYVQPSSWKDGDLFVVYG